MKIILFSPYSVIWQHAFPEAALFDALREFGHEIVYVGCGKIFRPFCTAMNAHGLRFGAHQQKCDQVCNICQEQYRLLQKEFCYEGPLLSELITEYDDATIKNLMNDLTAENYLGFHYHGVEVGRLSTYEFLLNNKKNNLIVEENLWPELYNQIKNSLTALIAAERIISTHKPDAMIFYNTFYSVNHVAAKACEQAGVSHYLLHAGSNQAHRLSTLQLSQSYSHNFLARHPQWERYKHIPCSETELRGVTEHILALLSAKSVFVYSTPKSEKALDGRKFFAIHEDQKVLVATMSSHDERFAAVAIGTMPQDATQVFPSQIEWIQALLDYIADKPDLFLIIRVHPREFPNKREAATSAYATQLQEKFQNLPENSRVNWPSDQFSLYDIAQFADVFLNSRSTTGLEMNLLGLPVVLYSPDQMYAYPPDLNFGANSKEEYFQLIERTLDHGWDIEFARQAFRWGVFQYHRSVVDISECYAPSMPATTTFLGRVVNWVRRRISPYYVQRRDLTRRTKPTNAAARINFLLESKLPTLMDVEPPPTKIPTLDEETEALRNQFRTLYDALYSYKGGAKMLGLQSRMYNFIRER